MITISLKLIFGVVGFAVGISELLIFYLRPYTPSFVLGQFTYGKFAEGTSRLQINVPKRWFKHFYKFAAFWSTFWFIVMYLLYTDKIDVAPWPLMSFMDVFDPHRECNVSSAAAYSAIILLLMQCWKRWYETHFISVFSSKARITLLQYILGHLHYFACVLAIVMEAPGFSRRGVKYDVAPKFTELTIAQYAASIAFLFAWIKQYDSASILGSLRKNDKGDVVTEKHVIPKGGLFSLVSSPHLTCEIIMYLSLQVLLLNNTIFPYILFWVVSNQVGVALLTHKWYKDTFKDYPKERRAIVPYIL